MLALYRAGRQAEALEAYREARSVLVEQIGVEPGLELRRLQEAILAQDSVLELPAPPADSRAPPEAGSPARRRTRRGLVAAAALLLFAGLGTFALSRALAPDDLGRIEEDSVGLIDPDSGRITAQYAVGRAPGAVVAGGGSVWVANTLDGTVSRIDRERDEVVTIPVGGAPAGLAFGAGSLWVADSDSRQVAQVDPGANKVSLRIEVGNAPHAVAAAAGALWVASGVDGRVQRIDLDRGRVTRRIPIGANPSAIAAGAGALWVASEEAGTVTRIEPRTGKIVGAIGVGNGPSAIATGEGAVWVVNRHDGTLSRIDPAKNSVSWTVEVGSDPAAVAAGGGSVWVAGGEEGAVTRVDPEQGRVVDKVRTGSSPAAIAVTGGSTWAAAAAPQTAHRGGTLRAFVPDLDATIPIDWLHWQAYTTYATFQFSSLAYDGLVAYRRVEGAAGATIVGALATTAPAPSRDGRTYVFTLRPGLRYSDGRPVLPTDFRASMERFLEATRYSTDRAFPPLYAGIVGARTCMTGDAPCDLARGIETDARSRTITIHLTRPDSDLLPKLAMAFAFVVPADSPRRASTGRTPPGTGPYRVADWAADRGGTLVRNRYFRSTPSRSRGEGFADRIEIAVRKPETIERQIADVQRGASDLAVIADPFASLVSPARLQALVARSPGLVHSDPAPTTDWMSLNVQRRPFDDSRVRRAVNLAIDRARVVELAGGVEVGQPACQVVPAGFPGYEPYCPYTASPTAGGGWTAPDLERARRLVAASGRAGERVVVKVGQFKAEVGRYFAGLLDDLGFRATLRVQPDPDYDLYDLRTRSQTGYVGWLADYLAPSTFVEANFACGTGGAGDLNVSRLCDRTLDRRIRRALETPPAEAAAAWVAANRRLTDLAAAVPMTRRRSVVLVSKRVGNVKHHAQWFTLLDQLWVR